MSPDVMLAYGAGALALVGFWWVATYPTRQQKARGEEPRFGLTRAERVCLLTHLAVAIETGRNVPTFRLSPQSDGYFLWCEFTDATVTKIVVCLHENGSVNSIFFIEADGKSTQWARFYMGPEEDRAGVRLMNVLRDRFLAGRSFASLAAEIPPPAPERASENLRTTALFRESGCCSQEKAQEKA